MWSSFLFTCRWLFIMFTPKSVVPCNFLSIRIALSCFYLLIFYYWEILNLNLTFVVYVNVKLLNDWSYMNIWKSYICELRSQELCEGRSSQFNIPVRNFCSCEKKALTYAMLVQRSTNKLTSQLGAGRWIGLLLTHERMMTKFKYEYMKIIMWTVESRIIWVNHRTIYATFAVFFRLSFHNCKSCVYTAMIFFHIIL